VPAEVLAAAAARRRIRRRRVLRRGYRWPRHCAGP
jgi:hypothetical protein